MGFILQAGVLIVSYGLILFMLHMVVKYFPRDAIDRIISRMHWNHRIPGHVGIDFPDVRMTEYYEDDEGREIFGFKDIERFTMTYLDDDGRNIKVISINEKIEFDDESYVIGFVDKQGFFLDRTVDANSEK